MLCVPRKEDLPPNLHSRIIILAELLLDQLYCMVEDITREKKDLQEKQRQKKPLEDPTYTIDFRSSMLKVSIINHYYLLIVVTDRLARPHYPGHSQIFPYQLQPQPSYRNQPQPPYKKSTSISNQTTTPVKTLKPPLIILSSDSWRKVAPKIYALPNLQLGSLTVKSSNNQISLQTSDPSQFRLIQSALLFNDIEFHTFSLPEERSLKIVLKGIPTDVPTVEDIEELETLGFCVIFIRRFGIPEKLMPLCLVHITSNADVKDIFLLNSLFYIQISVEPLKL
ncbi:hypothetical protein QTP88_025600 [Uroleucon formosanum]